jgi:hypothetical protein
MASVSDAQQPLQLVLYTPLNVDGGATTASTTLELRNPNETALKYILAIQNVKASNTNKTADWVVTFYGADNKPAGPMLEGTADASQLFSVRVDLSHVVEAGESTAELQSNNVKIADLRLVKELGLPFRVSLEGNPVEKPEIEFVRGSALDFRMRNDDPMNYPVLWEFFVKGKAASGTVMVGPNGSTKFTVMPDDGWFSGWRSLFKNEAIDGTLTLGYKPPGAAGAYPSKTIPIRANLSYWNPATRDSWAMVLIVIILALGGITSAYVNVDLVNRLKTISINKRVGQIARVLGEVGPQLNSQLRVSLWLERGRITATLPSGILFTPGTTAVLAQSDADTAALKVRVELAAQISDAIKRQQTAIDSGIGAPTLVERITEKLSAAQDLLKKSVLSNDELQKIHSLVGDATNCLDCLGQQDEDLEKLIHTRLNELKARFTKRLDQDPRCATIKAVVPIPFGLLAENPTGAQRERDANTRKLMVIADLVQMQSADDEVLQSLARQDFDSLLMAELLLAQLKDGVSLDDLKGELTASPQRVYFTIDRDTVRVNRPIMMRLMFNKSRYNRAAAKRRVECTWSFDHDNLTEKGWEVYHYFPQPRPDSEAKDPVVPSYRVEVTFKDTDQVVIPTPSPITKEVMVSAARPEKSSHFAVEMQRWAVGFLVALLGLFAGAQDKILSLDTAGAIVAVFVLGFGIDMVKNLLVSK